MGWTFTTGEGGQGVPDEPEVFVEYGWGPLHAFERTLAREEGPNLPRMKDYGGTEPWTDDLTPLRPLFDLDYVTSDHSTANYPVLVSRLRDVHTRWAAAYPEDDAPHGCETSNCARWSN